MLEDTAAKSIIVSVELDEYNKILEDVPIVIICPTEDEE